VLRRHDLHGQAAVSVPRDGGDVQGRRDDVQSESVRVLLLRLNHKTTELGVGDYIWNRRWRHRRLLSWRRAKSSYIIGHLHVASD
jgi:hypothetical protein